jgi:hypothetical protein
MRSVPTGYPDMRRPWAFGRQATPSVRVGRRLPHPTRLGRVPMERDLFDPFSTGMQGTGRANTHTSTLRTSREEDLTAEVRAI